MKVKECWNLERDVKFWLNGTQLSQNGKKTYDCGDTVAHRCTVNNVANHLDVTMPTVSRKQAVITPCNTIQ